MKLLHIHEPGETPEPHDDAVAVGIDLGTTNSVVAVVKDGEPVALEDAAAHSVIPSVVSYNSEGMVMVGHGARARLWAGDKDTVGSIKRLMGRSYDEAVRLMLHDAARLAQAQGDAVPRLMLGGVARTPVEVSAEILYQLKQVAEAALGKDVTQAVITVPAYFDDAARVATKDAAKIAGLEVLRLINEPTAAALAYGLDKGAEGIYAIYDLGGGTFDISLLRLENGVFQVLATAGDTALGGDDVDRALAEWFVQGFKVTMDAALLGVAREVKETLSNVSATVFEYGGKSTMVSRQAFDRLTKPLVGRTIAICGRALEDANIGAEQVKGVVLVGGATRMHAVREAVEAFFGMEPLADADPDRVVAYGAAIQAQQLSEGGGDHLLLDVIPLSLGLETMGGLAERLLYRNTPIPAVAVQEFTTYQDGQTGLQIHVVQGEREMVDQCRSLAKFELTGIPPMKAGVARVAITFQVDADGLLTVTAEEKTTGAKQQVEVKPTYGLPLEEVERMLEESMKHARQDISQRLLVETKIEAGRLAQEVRDAMEDGGDALKPGEEGILQGQITRLEKAAQGSDRDRIDHEMQRLSELVTPFAERRMNAALQQALKGKSIGEAEKL